MTEQREPTLHEDDSRDPYIAALEQVARSLPAVPWGWRQLRQLLALLPDPSANTLREARPPAAATHNPNAPAVGISQTLLGPPPGTTPPASVGDGTVPTILLDTDVRQFRVRAKTWGIDDTAGGAASLEVDNQIPAHGASWAIDYNLDGTVKKVTRSGAAGACVVDVNWSGGSITSIVTAIAGRTITITPTYSGPRINGITRTIA